MKLNGTLFVQMINFAIAYIMIRYFLLKPLIPIILRDRKKVVDLSYAISNQKETLDRLDLQQQAQWLELQTYTDRNKDKLVFSRPLESDHAPCEFPALNEIPSYNGPYLAKQIVHSLLKNGLWRKP